jgi:hypothetical protein
MKPHLSFNIEFGGLVACGLPGCCVLTAIAALAGLDGYYLSSKMSVWSSRSTRW